MSNRVSPEPIVESSIKEETSNDPTKNSNQNASGEGVEDDTSNTNTDSDYKPDIDPTLNVEVEAAATYDPPDFDRSDGNTNTEEFRPNSGNLREGGFVADDLQRREENTDSDPFKNSEQQREEEEKEEDTRTPTSLFTTTTVVTNSTPKSSNDDHQQEEDKDKTTPIFTSSALVSSSSDSLVDVSQPSANADYNNSPVKPQGRLPPLGGSSIEREDEKLPPVMSARQNSGIARKASQDVIGANDNQEDSGCCAIILTILSYILVVLFFPFSLCLTIKVVQEYERAVIFRLGRLLPGGAKGPGIFFVMPCIEEYTKVDLRTVSFDVPPQEVLTRDSVTVSVDAVVYYRISNPTVSVANVENAANSTQLLAQTTLRNVLGTQNLAEILSNREHISEQMQNVLDDATDKWGIKVERVEIKDVRLPTQLQRAMAAEAEAARDARAKVIAAEGEQKASVALKEAADIIVDSPAALQLRYLQTLNSISAEKNSTIIFPLPIEMLAGLTKKK